jgi:hypothetical protein
MKIWKHKVLIDNQKFDVVEHTDKECERPRTDGTHLAPISHGFVCLYQKGKYKQWCGVNFAEKRIIK